MADKTTNDFHRHEQPDLSETVHRLDIGSLQELAIWQTTRRDADDAERAEVARIIEADTQRTANALQLMSKQDLLSILDTMRQRGIRSSLIATTRSALQNACNGSLQQTEVDARKTLTYLYVQLRISGYHKWFEDILRKD